MYHSLIVAFLILHSQLFLISAELFTALTDMEVLLETEALLIENVTNFISSEEKKLELLRVKLSEYKKHRTDKVSDPTYLLNPVNAFLLTKRLTVDWVEIEKIVNNNDSLVLNFTQIREDFKFPSDEDLNGAAVGLTRLQDTYDLDTHKVAQGILNGVNYKTEMTASDCFEVGRQSYYNQDYHHAVLWLDEALHIFEHEQNQTINKSDILDYLYFCVYKQGDIKLAIELLNEFLEMNPDHERGLTNRLYFEMEIEEKERLRGDDGSYNVPVSKAQVVVEPPTDRQIYEMVCREELTQTHEELAKLKCRYVHDITPFLKIAPLKMEEVSLKPYIVVYHQVMYDSEIKVIKEKAKPKLERAGVQNFATGKTETAQYRISKAAFISEKEHEVLATIGRRVHDMTGLSTRTAEDWQVVNYGIGGHYEPHYDFAVGNQIVSHSSWSRPEIGNRVATVLFYMTDVPQGGATAFPLLRLAVKPNKGSAAFWFNLHRDGEGDLLTKHAACPVLVGTKWIATRWFHSGGQEFLRPCQLKPDSPQTQN